MPNLKEPVVPGDTMHLHVEFLKERRGMWKFYGEARVNDKVVCSADLMCARRESYKLVIHEQAIIEPGAQIGENVSIGPWTYIGKDVVIGDNCDIRSNVVIKGPTTIGKNNTIYQFATIGEDCQDLKYAGEPTQLIIGDNNTFRECCTIHRGTIQDNSLTQIGSNNLFMAYTHVAHDCMVLVATVLWRTTPLLLAMYMLVIGQF